MSTNTVHPFVLVVEDQKNWRDMLRLALQKHYRVDTAQSLDEARQIIFESGRPYYVAVIDIRLDDTDLSNNDGLELAREIRDRLNGLTSMILITAYPSVATIKSALRDLDVFEYLEKYPQESGHFDLKAFQNIVHRAATRAADLRDEMIGLRALIIEDEGSWRDTLSKMLSHEGLDVDSVSSAAEACARAKETDYKIIVIDLKLGPAQPEEGIDLLDALKRIRPEARFIIVTGYATLTLALGAFSPQHQSCVAGFFEKHPFDRNGFLDAVRRASFPKSQLISC